MEKRTILSYLIAIALLMTSMNPLLAITGQQMRNAHDAINQFISLNLNSVTAEEYAAKKEAALRAAAQFSATQRAKYVQAIQLQERRYAGYTNQQPDTQPEQPKKKQPVDRERVAEDNVMPEDWNFDFEEQSKGSFFDGSFIKKNMPKIVMAAIGAAAIGAYEWFASNNPGTVPELGIKKMLSSVWKWFAGGKKEKQDDATKESDKSDNKDASDTKEDNADQNKDAAQDNAATKDDASTKSEQKNDTDVKTTGQSDVVKEPVKTEQKEATIVPEKEKTTVENKTVKIEKPLVDETTTVPVNNPVTTTDKSTIAADKTPTTQASSTRVDYTAVVESEDEDDVTDTTPIIITNTPSVKPTVVTPGIKVNNSHIVYEQTKDENKSAEVDGDMSNEFGSISVSDKDEKENIEQLSVESEQQQEPKHDEPEAAQATSHGFANGIKKYAQKVWSWFSQPAKIVDPVAEEKTIADDIVINAEQNALIHDLIRVNDKQLVSKSQDSSVLSLSFTDSDQDGDDASSTAEGI